MVDFIKSFNRGLEAAQQAGRNKEEINAVISLLNEQLLKVSDGKLEIDIYTKSQPLAGFFSAMSAMNPTAEAPKPAYQFLAAVNPLSESKTPIELARWKLDPNGYPCQITTPDSEFYCEDRSALERGLQNLLSDPIVGEKIYSVMRQKLKDAVEPGED